MTDNAHWYALKVFYNKVLALQSRFADEGCDTYCPLDAEGKPLVASLLFVRCPEARLVAIHRSALTDEVKFAIYTRKELRPSPLDGKPQDMDVPAPIREDEMRAFILVTSAGPGTFEVLGPDDPKYHTGQRVRVTEGPFAGSEGVVKRIKKDRRLVITVTGIVAVATVHINPAFLQPITEN